MPYVGVDLIEADKLAELLTKAEQVTKKAMKNKQLACEQTEASSNFSKRRKHSSTLIYYD